MHKELNTVWNNFIKPTVIYNGKLIDNKIKQIMQREYTKRLIGAAKNINV